MMAICLKLGKTEEEISHWTIEQLGRWLAFLKIVKEEEAVAYEKAKKQQELKNPTRVSKPVKVRR